MLRIYRTINERQMERLLLVISKYRYQGNIHGDPALYTRSNGRVDVLYHWPELDDLPRSVSIRSISSTTKPYRFYQLQGGK